jgi:hypothetical protein
MAVADYHPARELLTGFTVVPVAENGLGLDKQATNVGLHSGIQEVLQFAVDQCPHGFGVDWHPQRYREMLQLESWSSVERDLRVGLSGGPSRRFASQLPRTGAISTAESRS